MFMKILPKQDSFFELFRRAADELVGASDEFAQLTKDFSQLHECAKKISARESVADDCALATFDLLHKTFITPFDRYDIHQITRRLDDIIDLIHRTTQRIVCYELQELPDEIQQIAVLGSRAAESVRVAIHQLEFLKNAPAIMKHCYAISEIDRQAEQIMLQGVGKLFSAESDFKRLLKLKEIYEYSTRILSECHDLADVIKDIVLEYS